METNDLIRSLATTAEPVRRLDVPWRRTALWLAASLPAVVALPALHFSGADIADRIDLRLAIEQTAILLTALTAALAAFSTTIPGRDRRIAYLPLIPLALWLASLGEGCVQDWLRSGSEGIRVRADWDCAALALMLSIVPAAVMIIMLRRGAPLLPRATFALGALAMAAMVNFGLRIFHAGDISIQVLTWHFGGALVLAALASPLGRYLLRWRFVPAPA